MKSPKAPRAPASGRPWPLRALALLGAWLALELVMIGLAIAWVALYSHAIAPGQDPAEYEAYARRAVPWVALTISAPVFGVLAFVSARRAGVAGRVFARNVTIVFVVVDVALFAFSTGVPASVWAIGAVAAVLKLTGLVAGGRLGARAHEARATFAERGLGRVA